MLSSSSRRDAQCRQRYTGPAAWTRPRFFNKFFRVEYSMVKIVNTRMRIGAALARCALLCGIVYYWLTDAQPLKF